MTNEDANRIATVDSGTATHTDSFDPETEPASEAVVRVVAAATGREPDNLESIDNVVDPIVFDALVRRQRRPLRLEFNYEGQAVTIESSGRISVQQRLSDDSWSQSFQFADSESASETIVRAIAEVRGVDPTEMRPLCDYIDPESLDRTVGPQTDQSPTVSFLYDELRVVVTAENTVTLYS